MNDVKIFLDKKISLNKDDFLSEAVDNGFRIAKKPNEYKYTDNELQGMTIENIERVDNNSKTIPDFVLIQPQNKIILELFIEDNKVKQANAVFKFSFPADNLNCVDDIDKITRGLGIQKFEKGRLTRTECIMFKKQGQLTNLNNTLNDMKSKNVDIVNERVSLDKNELSLLTFMHNKTDNTMQMQFKLNQMLGEFNKDIVDYKSFYSAKRKIV
jgi:hypothetical protein